MRWHWAQSKDTVSGWLVQAFVRNWTYGVLVQNFVNSFVLFFKKDSQIHFQRIELKSELTNKWTSLFSSTFFTLEQHRDVVGLGVLNEFQKRSNEWFYREVSANVWYVCTAQYIHYFWPWHVICDVNYKYDTRRQYATNWIFFVLIFYCTNKMVEFYVLSSQLEKLWSIWSRSTSIYFISNVTCCEIAVSEIVFASFSFKSLCCNSRKITAIQMRLKSKSNIHGMRKLISSRFSDLISYQLVDLIFELGPSTVMDDLPRKLQWKTNLNSFLTAFQSVNDQDILFIYQAY